MPPSSQYQAAPARFTVLNFGGGLVTNLDRLAMNRAVTLTLNDAAEADADVPSDSYEVNGFHTSGPFVTMSDKQLVWFRRENTTGNTPWVPRFSGIIQQVNDEITSSTDAPVTHLTAFDPWGVWKILPVLNANGAIPGSNGITYNGAFAGDIIADLLNNAYAGIQNLLTTEGWDCPVSAQNLFCLWKGQPGTYAGLWDTVPLPSPVLTPTWDNAAYVPQMNFKAGTMLGDAITQMTQAGYCDVMLTPIYLPFDAPGICTVVSVFNFAGQQRPGALFGWDRPGRSLVGANRLQDGSKLANVGIGYAGQSGPAVQPVAVKSSVETYGPVWLQTTYTGELVDTSAVETLMIGQIVLLQKGQQTLTVDISPERAPRPFLDYNLADSIPVMFSNLFRETLNPAMNGAAMQATSSAVTPLTVADGVNDEFIYGSMLFVIPAGTYATVAEIAAAVNGALYGGTVLFSTVATVSYNGTFLTITSVLWGSDGVTVGTGTDDALADLGFTSGQALAGESWVNYQRIYEMPFSIPDDGVETLTQLSLTPPSIDDSTDV